MSTTWDDIFEYVSEIHLAESGSPNGTFYKTLAHRALREMSRLLEVYRKTYTSSDLTLSDGEVALPTEAIRIADDGVRWNDVPLPLTSVSTLNDQWGDSWAAETGASADYYYMKGRSLRFYPKVSSIGNLEIDVVARLPDFPTGEETVEPLDYVPDEFQLLPAYYILWKLPINSANKEQGSERRMEYQAEWKDGLAAAVDSVQDVAGRTLTY